MTVTMCDLGVSALGRTLGNGIEREPTKRQDERSRGEAAAHQSLPELAAGQSKADVVG